MKTAFWFCLRLCRLWSSESLVVGVASSNRRTKPVTKRGHVHCDWSILLLLLPTLTIWFSLDHKWQNHKQSRKKMETFWFFQLPFHCTYDSNFWFSLSHKRFNDSSYNSDSNSIASENQPWGRSDTQATGHIGWNWLHVTWHCFIMGHWSHARTLAMILTAVLMALCTTQITSCPTEIIQCVTTNA